METPSSPAASPARNEAAAPGHADWHPAPGIIDRMSAYRDWWNIPSRRGRPAGGKARNRPRDRDRRDP